MNQTIGLAEAKAHLSDILDRIEAGQSIVITRNGKPVAEMRPVRPVSAEEAVKRIRAIARRVAKRNAGKTPVPPETARRAAHERHRF